MPPGFAAASAATARGWPLPALVTVSLVFFWDALVLWTVVAVGLLHRAVSRTPAPPSGGGQTGYQRERDDRQRDTQQHNSPGPT